MPHLNDTCPICSAELQNIRNELRGSRRDESGNPLADIVVLESWCTSCEIFLTRRIIGRESDTGWKTSFVQEDTLTRSLTPDAVAEIVQGIDVDLPWKERLWKEQLEKFLSMKKEQDEFYEYVSRDERYIIKGFTIKRGENLVGRFVYFIEEDSA
jgi:hypothetical protein